MTPRVPGLVRPILSLAALCLLGACGPAPPAGPPAIAFRTIPPADEGGPDRLDPIEGRVAGSRRGQHVVVYARSGVWWVQPFADTPFTAIQADGTWRTTTHLGTDYAALLVEPGYKPPPRAPELPSVGGGVLAVATVKGAAGPAVPATTLQWSGHQWKVRTVRSDRGGRGQNTYSSANVRTDAEGALRLRLSTRADGWVCAELSLLRGFGYGTYRFVVRDIGHLDPRAVLTLFTWDETASDEKHREMDIEISRWGDPASKNAQFVVQPFFVPANVARFAAPAGVLTHTLRWEKEQATFTTIEGRPGRPNPKRVAEYAFRSGVPAPGNETVRINLYAFGTFEPGSRIDNEVVVESFEYLP